MRDAECYRIQNMIEPFLTGDLSVADQEKFVAHIRSCSECRAELEEYNIIYSAMSDDDDTSYSNEGLSEDVERMLLRVEIAKRRRIRSRVYLSVAAVGVLAIMVVAVFLFF